MPAETQLLPDFIDGMKNQGASDEFVVALLRQNGWSEKRIYQSMGAWYETRTGRPVPNGGGRIEAAKDAFLYLLAFITLGIWSIQLGALLFTAIERTFPNAALDYPAAGLATRNVADELASILVGFPLFLLVTWAILRGVARQPERLESAVRKWLTYIALVLTASTVIGDLVTFLAYFLRGDLDIRFVLKVITVFVIAGGVFAYYLDSLRRDKISAARNRAFAVAALALAGFGIVVGFGQVGPPANQRAQTQDARRLFDLSTLAEAVHARWQSRGQNAFVLPATIQEVQATNFRAGARIVDPVTGELYFYAPLTGTAYRLCASFSRPSAADVPPQWQHQAGRACFSLDASQEAAVTVRPF